TASHVHTDIVMPSLPSLCCAPPPPTPDTYPLSLHDALPISVRSHRLAVPSHFIRRAGSLHGQNQPARSRQRKTPLGKPGEWRQRSEEHTSELQSRFDLVCRLLLEKKKTTTWSIRHRYRDAPR